MRAMLFVFVVTLTPGALWAQDICRDEFVSCVQQSGDSFACRSVYTNCQASQGNDLVSQPASSQTPAEDQDELQFSTEIINPGSALTSIRLRVSNPTNQPIQVGNATYPVRCADGSSDRAVFFMDFQVDAGVRNQSAGGDQIVCIGAGGAVSVNDSAAEVQGLASVNPQLEYEYPCANDEYRWITLQYTPQGVYRWQNSQGYEGVLNRDFLTQADFAEQACAPLQPPGFDLINWSAQRIRGWFDNPGTGKVIYYRNGGSGVRG